MTAQDRTVGSLTAQVHQLTLWVGELQQRLRLDKFGGNGYNNWSDDVKAAEATTIARALRRAERRRDNAGRNSLD